MDELMISSANLSVSRIGASECHVERCVSSISCWNNTFIQGEKTLHLAVSAANCWHLSFWWKTYIILIPTIYQNLNIEVPLIWESWNFTFAEMSLQSYLDQNFIGRISIPSSWPERPSARALQPYAWEGWTNTTKDDDYPTIQRVLTIPGWCRILSINIINSISSFVAMIVQVWMGRDWYIIKSGLKAGIDGFIWEDSRLLCFMPQNSTLIEFQQLLFSFQLMFPLHQFTRWFQPGTKKSPSFVELDTLPMFSTCFRIKTSRIFSKDIQYYHPKSCTLKDKSLKITIDLHQIWCPPQNGSHLIIPMKNPPSQPLKSIMLTLQVVHLNSNLPREAPGNRRGHTPMPPPQEIRGLILRDYSGIPMNMVGFGEFTLFFEKMRETKTSNTFCDLLTFYQQ